jgi:hypothetical protein
LTQSQSEEREREGETWWSRVSRGIVLDFASTIAVLYAIGLLIVNLDLARYGVVAVDLARPEYIMVGLLWALLVTLTITAIWYEIWFVRDRLRPIARYPYFAATGGRTALLFVALVDPAISALYVLSLMIVCGHADDFRFAFSPKFINLVLGLLLQSVLIIFAAWIFINLLPTMTGKRKSILVSVSALPEQSRYARILAFFIVTSASIGFGLIGLIVYSSVVFSQIPREWGGDMKPIVEVFLTERLPVFVGNKDIPLTIDGKRIGPVICIQETDRTLMIVSLNHPDRRDQLSETIAIDRKLVTAVVYEGRYAPSPSSSPNAASSPSSAYTPTSDAQSNASRLRSKK